MQRARVIAAHRALDRPAFRLATSDAMTLGERRDECPQLVWATLAQGLGGWMTSAVRCCDAPPAVLLDRESGETSALGVYDTREVDTAVGQVVTLHYPQDGGRWTVNAAGRSSWIPAHAIEFIHEKPPLSL